MDFNLQAVGHEAHHAGGLDPGNFLELRFAFAERDEEDVASDVAAHDFHDLGARNVVGAADFNVVARFDPETPVALAVVIKCRRQPRRPRRQTPGRLPTRPADAKSFSGGGRAGPETRFCPRRKGDSSSTSRSTRRASSNLALRFARRRIQLFLQDGGTRFPRHQIR